ncbi:calcium-dependent protein kinase 26 [Dioscorea cayenensis subsp. rotundata]|uniref:Calcium-dependent protein kinase 26 n=1 Tax=Dioscorea cayennensis subsp. rotundata TaxID=55577 RepID=A0AB40C860_DIOCR|nr:calcium-dependent protein kinase 26 [Dioscorea cayenensis subsp. rotundata]
MAVARSNGIDLPCNCYKVPGLKDPILETPHISYLEDRYTLGQKLGSGQFGLIRACSDMLTGETLACKSIAKDCLLCPDDLRSVKLEIEVMARLSGHPNVVDLKAVYEDVRFVHLVMELCAGGELFHRLEKHGRFPEPEAAVLFQCLMEVVMYCHDKGVVHRDLKPENILLATKSLSSPIKLADFGLATYIKPGQSLHGTVGSPFYIAPEVLAGGYNQAADVWSAGVILYILLSGMPPFRGKTKSRIFDSVRSAELRFPSDPWDHVSESAKDLIAGMLCRDPSRRLSAKEVLDHPWVKGIAQQAQSPNSKSNEFGFGQKDLVGFTLSTSVICKTRDFSFGLDNPIPCENQQDQSSAFTCRSSFSSFLVETTPSTGTGFSFDCSCECSSPRFSTSVPFVSSFSFLSPSSSGEQQSESASQINMVAPNTTQIDSSCEKLFMPPDSSASSAHEIREIDNKRPEFRRGLGVSSRVIGLHSRRNHTIGLGELDQLDLMVSESVIRWASCTHLPSAASLWSSLVC